MTSSTLPCRIPPVEQVPLVTLTTDFGTADGYVGTMKGVILSIAPDVLLVDISHEIAPQNVRQAAYVLYTAYPFFPSHAVHLAVVDPGVGSARRPIALRTPAGYFVGPDNGIFSYVMACEPVEALVELDPRQFLQVSHTFHGRDVFAPVAAHLAAGLSIAALGSPVLDPVTFSPPRLEVTPAGITGEVLHTDHFGNVITSIGRMVWGGDELVLEPIFWRARGGMQVTGGKEHEAGDGGQVRVKAGEVVVVVGGREIAGVHRTYAEVASGEALALVGSQAYLEIAVREGNAALELGLHVGDVVALRLS
ncbi:MAG: SAM-dependent chlorinase/fluorinase [Chloroflexota bacterium]|nr:SAM-dependent chlorinase/fluorinase [Chloroflexota bacterium]